MCGLFMWSLFMRVLVFRGTFVALILFVLLSIVNSAFARQVEQDAAGDEARALENIKQLIDQTQNQLNEKLADSERLQQELKLAELKIAETATFLNKTETKLSQTQIEMRELNTQKQGLVSQIKAQQDALAAQVKSAFMAGDYDFAKMIFNQNEANKFERVLTYYQYLNKARQAEIESFRQLVDSLDRVQQRLDKQEQQLASLVDQQAQQSSLLQEQQQDRFSKFRALERQIASDQARVSQLQQQEADLLSAIEQAELAAKRAEDVDLAGLTGKKKSLLVPASGKINRLFGKRRQGQVRWKGIVINAKSGAPVVAVADGVVLYSDWLKGFGLVTIVDHGKGYMTVYGRNQALLRKVGDVVVAGDTISLVGNSGGQVNSGLYFEIRHKGKALNPTAWLAS